MTIHRSGIEQVDRRRRSVPLMVVAGILPLAWAVAGAAEASRPCEILVPCSDARGCPDFVVYRPDALSPDFLGGGKDPRDTLDVFTVFFPEDDCNVIEGNVGPGSRKLALFNTRPGNLGPGALFLGNPLDHPEWFDLVTCHGHPHLKDYADYRLWTLSGYERWMALRLAAPGSCSEDLLDAHPELSGQLVNGPGRKRGFCLVDFKKMRHGSGAWKCPHGRMPDPQTYIDCNFAGLGVCWYDSYAAGVDGQWVDITGVPDGDYVLEIEVNATHLMDESTFDNNFAATRVRIAGDTVTIVALLE